ncbi:DUF4158 domain-containing protein [Nocardiopsis tropica]|nr:DUF4158 domain-containing protein [Nocardiopsis tropica]
MAYLSGQLDIADPGCLSDYATREKARSAHAWELQRECGFEEFSAKQSDLGAWLEAQVWTTTDGPKALFDGAVAWMRRRAVLLPGVTVLARLVPQVREEVTERPREALCALITPVQQVNLESLLVAWLSSRRWPPLTRAEAPVGYSGVLRG